MASLLQLLRYNRNYRYTWIGQVVSEVGDHFNNIAVFDLALTTTGSGLVVSGVMLSRAVPVMFAGPLAGVVLDRFDRKRIMILSDILRAVIALCFVITLFYRHTWLLFLLSGLLMLGSPFFTAGRAAILPAIASKEEMHSANSLTQATAWTTTTIGTFLGGTAVAQFGYEWAFLFNALSFVISALCIAQLKGNFRVDRSHEQQETKVHPWQEFRLALDYIRSTPLVLGIVLLSFGWATGGGAAQILFTLFGKNVFHRGAAGIGEVWGSAGLGLIFGAIIAHRIGKKISFEKYKVLISICYAIHGGAYVVFSQMRYYPFALFFICLSRAAVAVSSVLNFTQLLRHTPDRFRGRVFATQETLTWTTMLLSMLGAGLASQYVSVRTIGAVAGVLSSTTAIWWGFLNYRGSLPEPQPDETEEEVELHGEPTV